MDLNGPQLNHRAQRQICPMATETFVSVRALVELPLFSMHSSFKTLSLLRLYYLDSSPANMPLNRALASCHSSYVATVLKPQAFTRENRSKLQIKQAGSVFEETLLFHLAFNMAQGHLVPEQRILYFLGKLISEVSTPLTSYYKWI